MKNAALKPIVKLEWSRLLGFDQAEGDEDRTAATTINDPRLARLGAKFGGKRA